MSRLKILILVNLEINRKKTDNVYQLPTTARVISLKRKTIISQTVCIYALVYSYYRSSQLFRHISFLKLAGEKAARVLLTTSSDFEKIRS